MNQEKEMEWTETKEHWKPIEYECCSCGGAAEVLSRIIEPNVFYDGEEVRCTECPNTGSISVDDEYAYPDWDYEFGEAIPIKLDK